MTRASKRLLGFRGLQVFDYPNRPPPCLPPLLRPAVRVRADPLRLHMPQPQLRIRLGVRAQTVGSIGECIRNGCQEMTVCVMCTEPAGNPASPKTALPCTDVQYQQCTTVKAQDRCVGTQTAAAMHRGSSGIHLWTTPSGTPRIGGVFAWYSFFRRSPFCHARASPSALPPSRPPQPGRPVGRSS
jgi:hypothetical protein